MILVLLSMLACYIRIIMSNSFFFSTEHVAPPKKPPRPGAPAHLGNLAGLCPMDSYNEGVKVYMHTYICTSSKEDITHTGFEQFISLKIQNVFPSFRNDQMKLN